MGFTFASSLILENLKCREDWIGTIVALSVLGAAAGGLGSLVSLLKDGTIP